MTWYSEKMPISNRCKGGLMPTLIKKSWTVSKLDLLWHIQNDTNLVFVWQLSFWQDQGPAILGYNLWLILIPRWTVLDRNHRLPVKPWNKQFIIDYKVKPASFPTGILLKLQLEFCRNFSRNSVEITAWIQEEFRCWLLKNSVKTSWRTQKNWCQRPLLHFFVRVLISCFSTFPVEIFEEFRSENCIYNFSITYIKVKSFTFNLLFKNWITYFLNYVFWM